MLAVMGLRVWGAPAAAEPDAATATAVDEAVPSVAPARSPAHEDEPGSMPPARDNVSMPTPVVSRRSTPAAQPMAVPIAAPGTVNAAGLDWPALRAAVASCTACALSDSRTQTVFGTGHPHAHWMIVGEAPGEAEDLSGEPFVGRSGQLLDNMLRAIGLSRHAGDTPDPAKQVFIANTLKCRPPRNRNPLPDELARCEGFLIRQIELVRPKIILAMGSFAVQSLLRSNAPVGQLRGRVQSYQGVPLIVTYHPAYLLRQQGEKARAWDDLCLALDTVEAAGSHAARD
jgi:DNA polymerase